MQSRKLLKGKGDDLAVLNKKGNEKASKKDVIDNEMDKENVDKKEIEKEATSMMDESISETKAAMDKASKKNVVDNGLDKKNMITEEIGKETTNKKGVANTSAMEESISDDTETGNETVTVNKKDKNEANVKEIEKVPRERMTR